MNNPPIIPPHWDAEILVIVAVLCTLVGWVIGWFCGCNHGAEWAKQEIERLRQKVHTLKVQVKNLNKSLHGNFSNHN